MNLIWERILDFFRKQTSSYHQTFDPAHAQPVLKDLARFCRANGSTFGSTTEQTFVLIGRREVFLRIQERLNLSPDQLAELYSVVPKPKDEENG